MYLEILAFCKFSKKISLSLHLMLLHIHIHVPVNGKEKSIVAYGGIISIYCMGTNFYGLPISKSGFVGLLTQGNTLICVYMYRI